MSEPNASPSDGGFQISLKVLLIVLIGAGAGAGVLGRLFLQNLDLFRAAVMLLSSLVPFVLAIGTIVWIGYRARRKRLIVWGAVLLVMPLLGAGILTALQFYAGSSPSNLGIVSTRQLIDERLPNQIEEPWVWNELQRRLQAGSLSQQEVDDAVAKLTVHMAATRPEGWDQPLSWQRSFLSEAAQAGLISSAVLIDLCDAFYGPKPLLQPLPRIRESGSGFDIQVKYGSTWSDHSGLDLQLVWEVGRVLLDGKPLEVRRLHKHGEQWSGRYEGSLPAGNHDLVLEIDCAYVERAKLIGLNINDLPISRWPKPVKQWKQTVSAPFTVYSAEEPIVRLTTDPARDPRKLGAIRIDRFVVQADRDGKKKVILQTEFTTALSAPLSFDISALLDGQVVPLGWQWSASDGDGGRGGSGGPSTVTVEKLDPSVRQVDIVFTPNPRHIEHRPAVSEIWGGKIVLRGVPIERLDLETAEAAGEPGRD